MACLAKVQLAREQRIGERDERRKRDRATPAPATDRRRSDGDNKRPQAARAAICRSARPPLSRINMPKVCAIWRRSTARLLDQPARQSVAVQHVEQHQHDLRHREQAVIGRREDTNHQEGRRPLDQLAENLAARAPQNRAAHLLRPSDSGIWRLIRWIRRPTSMPGGLAARCFRRRKFRRIPRVFAATVKQNCKKCLTLPDCLT